MGTYWIVVLGFIGYKWALVMDISLSEAKMLKYQSLTTSECKILSPHILQLNHISRDI